MQKLQVPCRVLVLNMVYGRHEQIRHLTYLSSDEVPNACNAACYHDWLVDYNYQLSSACSMVVLRHFLHEFVIRPRRQFLERLYRAMIICSCCG